LAELGVAGPCDPDDPDAPVIDVEVAGLRCLVFRVPEHASSDPARLSPREQEIVRMVAKGYPNKMIAGVLEISTWTVSTYLRRIFGKLGVTSRAAMVSKVQRPRPTPNGRPGRSA
jgi:DNA-binding NarL/FixJ family response regulator